MDKSHVVQTLEDLYFGDRPVEQAELRALGRLLRPDIRQVIDVGASLGQYTRAFAGLASNASILAIESDPIRVERLKENCRAWASEYGADIRVVEAAASDTSGECEFFTSGGTTSGSLHQHDALLNAGKKITVRAVTLDEISTRFDNTFIKMDVEGAEYAAVKGADRFLRGNGNCFLIEMHVWGDPSRNKRVADVLDLFSGHGYRMSKISGHYFFSKTGSVNLVRYAWVKACYVVKEWIYFSPLRGPAQHVLRTMARMRRGRRT